MRHFVPGRKKAVRDAQGGFAAVEMAILSAMVLAPLLMILVEGSKIIGDYATLMSATREAARLVLRENGDTSGAAALVASLTSGLDGPTPEVEVVVTESETERNVKVQVDYVYQTIIAAQSQSELPYPDMDLLGGWDRTLEAYTVMPLP